MSKNVTLRLDDTLIREARHVAVENDMSLSQWVSDLIKTTISRRIDYDVTRKRAIKRLKKGFHLGGPLKRDEIYER